MFDLSVINKMTFTSNNKSRDSSVGIAVGYGLDDRVSSVRFPAGLGIFLFTASRTALGPTQPPVQWVLGALSLGVKRPGCEADRSPPSSAEVEKCVELYLHSPNTPSWRGAYLSTGRTLPLHIRGKSRRIVLTQGKA
jgi:hypothetical protein